MGFYEERLMPIIKRTVDELCKTQHMQEILHGTMSKEKFQFQLKQNFNYLKEFCRCWAVGMSRCSDYDELSLWYKLLKGTFESELGESTRYWFEKAGINFDDAENTIMAECKRSYTSHELARAFEGDQAAQVIALFPCTILYWHMGLELVPKCTLPQDNMYRYWLEFYVGEWYTEHCKNAIKLVNKLTENKSERELTKLLEIFAISCNYEYLQWTDMYHNMSTWPIDDIFPPKFTTIEKLEI
ncbi:MAG: TenA family protein [Bacillota bacterium]|jgi:thiaminase/transcriptional activator TenA